jgi:regulator of protease activity HflC (stomatin/prohibitin superfamily)
MMHETTAWKANGFFGILYMAIALLGGIYLFASEHVILGGILLLFLIIIASGITVVQPNEAYIVTYFGKYKGTIRNSGFWISVPFSLRRKISLRIRNFNSAQLKVNDIEGNPIEIAAVIVFKVIDSAKATFDVDNYEKFVAIQSETALRHVANQYPYDNLSGNGLSLRANTDEVAAELTRELEERLSVAGVAVIEARLTHLAYSPEIAGAMLQRQQASAVIAARSLLVQGAVGMVQMVLAQLNAEGGIHLDDERKAAMINNLMVAIVSDRSAHPVINTGSIY